MSRSKYDIVTVGGGLGEAALATVMAKAGAHVLVVERDERFQDRVRGEFMEPWGVAETIRLGVYEAIRSAANETPWWELYLGEMRIDRRDCVATTRMHPEPVCARRKSQKLSLFSTKPAGIPKCRIERRRFSAI